MEGLIVLCIGFIGYLFYRINSQKHQLTHLHSQIQRLQQQFTQLQQRLSKGEEQAVETEPKVIPLNTEAVTLLLKEQYKEQHKEQREELEQGSALIAVKAVHRFRRSDRVNDLGFGLVVYRRLTSG
jgi:chromosome segregation ATPase